MRTSWVTATMHERFSRATRLSSSMTFTPAPCRGRRSARRRRSAAARWPAPGRRRWHIPGRLGPGGGTGACRPAPRFQQRERRFAPPAAPRPRHRPPRPIPARAATSGSHQGRVRPATAKLIMGLVSIAPQRWRGSATGSPSGPSGANDRRKAIRIHDPGPATGACPSRWPRDPAPRRRSAWRPCAP